MTIYRGYEVVPHATGGFTWTDETGVEHFYTGEAITTRPFETESAALDDIDAYKRAQRSAKVG